MEIETVNGGVELAMPSESKATIAARCVNGGVHVEGLEIRQEEQGNDFERRRRLNGTMNGGGAKVNMSTTNGGVRLSDRQRLVRPPADVVDSCCPKPSSVVPKGDTQALDSAELRHKTGLFTWHSSC